MEAVDLQLMLNILASAAGVTPLADYLIKTLSTRYDYYEQQFVPYEVLWRGGRCPVDPVAIQHGTVQPIKPVNPG